MLNVLYDAVIQLGLLIKSSYKKTNAKFLISVRTTRIQENYDLYQVKFIIRWLAVYKQYT